jgi:hypothetical protein
MIEKLVKNRTPYLGKMVLKFERHPYYTSGKDGKLNKVHLNLWFTKLVTRFKPKQVMEGYSNIDPKKVELIEKYTGGVIGTHKWDNDEFVLEDSFLTKDGKYIGNIETAWWYFQNGMTVCEEYPNGVAIVWNTVNSDKTLMSGWGGIKGYYGYTHRGGGLFKIGDRLFDEKYNPVVEDYDEKEFTKWWKTYIKSYKKGDDFDKKHIYNDGIKSVIPFNKRGKHTIKNWEDARTAAINMSKYLS